MKKIVLIILFFVSYAAYSQVQLTSTGSGNAYALTFPGVYTYTNGIEVTFKANFTNTGAATINITNSAGTVLGAKTIKKQASADLSANDILSGQVVTLVYDGTNFQMVSASGSTITSQAWSLGGNTVTSVQNFGTNSAFDLPFVTNSTERMRLNSAGTILFPTIDNSLSLGAASNSWKDVYSDGYLYINGSRWTSLVANNTLIGTKGSESFSTGVYNLGVGQGSGNSITTGVRNTVVGHRAAESMSTASDNTLVGHLSGGLTSTLGDNNTFLGSYSGYGASNSGYGNTFIGTNVGGNNTTGHDNTGVGSNSAYNLTTGNFNTFLGQGSGNAVTTGLNNTFVGYNSGLVSTQRNKAGAIGYNAQADADNVFVIGGTGTDAVNVGIGTTAPATLLHIREAGVPKFSIQSADAITSASTFIGRINFSDQSITAPTAQASIVAIRDAASSGSTDLPAAITFFTTKDGTNNLNERMRIDNSGNVGIGTTAPSTAFHVVGNARITGLVGPGVVSADASGNLSVTSGSAITGSGTTNYIARWTPSGSVLGIGTLYDDGTYVGVGTSSPGAYKLNVNGDLGISGDGAIIGIGSGGGIAPRISYGYSSSASGGYGSMAVGYIAQATGVVSMALGQSVTASGYGAIAIGQSVTASGSNATAIGYNNTAAAANSTAMGAYMTTSSAATNSFGINLSNTSYSITNPNTMAVMGGNVGIGTVAPNAPLQFASAVANRKIVLFETANNDHQYYGLGINAGVLRYQVAATTNDHVFYAGTSTTTSTELMRIQGTGEVGIGVSNPAYKLEVNGNVKIDGTQLYIGTSTTQYFFGIAGSYMGCTDHFIPNNTNTQDLGTTSWRWRTLYCVNSPNVSSDRRLKENINNVGYGLNEIMKLRPVTYNLKSDKVKNIKLGLIAQEVQSIIPEVVEEGKDSQKMLGVHYSDLIPVLIKAIQEQEQKIQDLQKKVELLEKK